jgi:lipoprotein Spr
MRKIILITTLMLISRGLVAQTVQRNQFADYVEWLQTNNPLLGKFINEWIGVKYRLGGNTKRGIDCSQFSKRLYWDVYGKRIEGTCDEQWDQTIRIKKDSLQVGDIIFFRSRQSPSGWHCGVYIGDKRFVHAANRLEGVKISTLDEPRYLNSYKGAGRLN